jgi:hypothetical protein
MEKTVNRYQVRIPGHDPATQRATISLLGEGTVRAAIGRVNFYDQGLELPADRIEDGIIEMHLPLAAFAGIVALLQHDSPVKIALEDGRASLWNAEWEQVGETEQLRK